MAMSVQSFGLEFLTADRFVGIAELERMEMVVAALAGGPEIEALAARSRRHETGIGCRRRGAICR